MNKGGKRPGAGRKKGFAAKNAEEARRILSEMVVREITPIGEALVAKARQGDISAARELFDRAFGKSTAVAEISVTQNSQEQIEADRIVLRDAIRSLRSKNKELAS